MFEKNILVTGGAGFIGTNFVAYFARTYPNYRLIDLDALTYAGSRCAFDAQKQMPNVVPVEGDIRNAELVRELLEKYDITGVIHFAAESHVENPFATGNAGAVWLKPAFITFPPMKFTEASARRAFSQKKRPMRPTVPIRQAKPLRTCSFAPIAARTA